MVVYAFDVDETLEISKGPVKLIDLAKLREDGHIVGLCGNWAMVTLHCPDWHHVCSFVGPCGIEKHDFLRQLRQYIPGHDYVMVALVEIILVISAVIVALRYYHGGPRGESFWDPWVSVSPQSAPPCSALSRIRSRRYCSLAPVP